MDTLKKFFPLSFKRTDSVGNLIIGILIYLLVALAAGLLISLASLIVGWIPVIGLIIAWLLGIAGAVVELYVLAGIVIQLLVFFKVLK